jgi:hypothetical protein
MVLEGFRLIVCLGGGKGINEVERLLGAPPNKGMHPTANSDTFIENLRVIKYVRGG